MTPRYDAWRATGGDREAPSPAERLAILARAIGRLAPDWRDPERYYEARSELAEEARRLARWLEARLFPVIRREKGSARDTP